MLEWFTYFQREKRKMRRAVEALFIAGLLLAIAQAQNVDTFYHARFEARVTAEDAKDSYGDLLVERQQPEQPELCGKDKPGLICKFDSPFPSLFSLYASPSDPTNAGGYQFDLRWVPEDQAEDGKTILDRIRGLANAGKRFSCNESACLIVAPSVDDPHTATTAQASVQIFSVCVTPIVKGEIAAPNCSPVGISSLTRNWLAVATGRRLSSPPPPPSRPEEFPLAIVGEQLDDVEKVLLGIRTGLTQPKLGLVVQPSVVPLSISAGATVRVSPVIPPDRELVTVNVYGSPGTVSYRVNNQEKKLPFIGLWYNLTLWVNRYNTDRPNDWHMPTPQQQQIYEQELRARVKSALETLCSQKKQWDLADRSLLCGQNAMLFH
jgi:hypothetical protein